MTTLRVLLGAAGCVLFAACQSTNPVPPAEPGDCMAQLRFRGHTYAFHPAAVTTLPTPPPQATPALERADVLGCDSEVVDNAVPVRMQGVPVSVAVAVVKGWPGVYVAEGTDPSTWPGALRR